MAKDAQTEKMKALQQELEQDKKQSDASEEPSLLAQTGATAGT